MVDANDSKSFEGNLMGVQVSPPAHMLLRYLEKRRAGWLATQISSVLPQGSTLLNVGSGKGFLEDILLKETPAKYSFVSIEPYPIEQKTEGLGNNSSAPQESSTREKSRPLQESFETATFTQTFDAIVFSYSLHHLRDAEASLKKAFSVLKPGGKIFILEIGVPFLCTSKTKDWKTRNLPQLIENASGTILMKKYYTLFSPLFVITYEKE